VKINFNNTGTELRDMNTASVGQERFASAADANVRDTAPKGVLSKIFSAVAELFSEKHQARAIVAEAKRVSILDGKPVYTALEDLMDKEWLSGS